MKNKKELIETVELHTKEEDLDFYIYASDKGVAVSGNKKELLTIITTLIHLFKIEGKFTDEDVDLICKLSKIDESVIEKFNKFVEEF